MPQSDDINVAPPQDEDDGILYDDEDGEYQPGGRKRKREDEGVHKQAKFQMDDISKEDLGKKFEEILQQKLDRGKNHTLKMRDQLADYCAMKAKELLVDMINATQLDEDNIKRGKLALNRVKLCDELKKACANELMLSTLVHDSKNNILVIFERWLTPFQDGELPNLHLRTTILDILLDLKVSDYADDETGFGGVTIEDLKDSKIGFRLSYLKNHARETVTNKRKAKQIIQKWSRLIHNKTDSYTALAMQEKPLVKQLLEEKRANRVRDNPEENRSFVEVTRARIPRYTPQDYVIRPESRPFESVEKVPSKTKQRVNKKLNELRRKSQK